MLRLPVLSREEVVALLPLLLPLVPRPESPWGAR